MSRSFMIARLEEKCRYYNWPKYNDKQVYCMYQKYVLRL